MRYVFCLVALSQFLVPLLPNLGLGVSLGDRAIANGIGPELPTGTFFAIWGVIFSAYAVIAVWHFWRPTYISTHLSTPLICAGLGNIIWMLSSQSLGSDIIDFLLLVPIAYFAWSAAYRLQAHTSGYDGTPRSILHSLTVGLLAGWLSVAIAISVPEWLRLALNRDVSDAVWQSLWAALIPALVMAALFTRFISLNLWYYAALSWGILGIFWNTYYRLELHALGLVGLAILILMLRVRLGYRADS